MNKRFIGLAVLVILLAAAAVLGWNYYHDTYITIDEQTYRRDVTELDLSGAAVREVDKLSELTALEKLDLRDTGLTVEQYEQLRQVLPECQILWSIPFQNGYCAMEETVVTVTELSSEDVERLAYLEALTTVDAVGCRDYEVLEALKEARPELDVRYTVQVGGEEYREDTTDLLLENGDPEEIETALRYLPALTKVTLTGTVPGNEQIYEWMCQYPEVVFDWSFELFGLTVNSLDTKLILNEIPMDSVEEIESALKYFHNLEWVEMCNCGIPSEEMDALWKRHPETRFVWMVKVGVCELRTDITVFMPYQYGYDGYSKLWDKDIGEMKYLVDLICLDMGHMWITDISFLEYMPNMQYLILADTKAKDYTVLANLKELVFLELFMTRFDQAEVLTGLTKLQDLNLGNCFIKNVEPLKEMTWLHRLWIPTTVNVPYGTKLELIAALPNTEICLECDGSTGGGWRKSPNYYAMRDLLNMGYIVED